MTFCESRCQNEAAVEFGELVGWRRLFTDALSADWPRVFFLFVFFFLIDTVAQRLTCGSQTEGKRKCVLQGEA